MFKQYLHHSFSLTPTHTETDTTQQQSVPRERTKIPPNTPN